MYLWIRFRKAAALAIAATLASCAQGGTGGALPGANSETDAAPRSKVTSKIVIVIPKRKHIRRVLVRGHYVSFSTQSIAIAVTPRNGGAPKTFNTDLTAASNPNCTGSPLACTITLRLEPGKYAATFATYSGLLDENGIPTGDELSANQSVGMHVVAGKANSIAVTLDGIPAAVVLEPAAASTLTGSTAAGFTADKCGAVPQASPAAEAVNVVGVDAAGDDIIGPGAPTPALTSENPAILAVTKTANGFSLTHPISTTAQGPVNLAASVAPGSASGAGAASVVTSVTIQGGTAICGVITSYRGGQFPGQLILGPDDAIWFTSDCSGRLGECQNSINRITTDGTLTVHQLPTDGPTLVTDPYSLAAGPDGAIWFTQSQDLGNSIGRMTTDGTITKTSPLSKTSSYIGITAGPDGALWFTDNGSNSIGRISTGFEITEWPIPTTGSNPKSIVAGSDGALWFTESSGNKIGRITTGGAITETTLPSPNSGPLEITAGNDGALWFTESNYPKIGRITTGYAVSEVPIPTVTSVPASAFIASGPDGAMWFTSGANVGRIATDRTVTELPASPLYTSGIVAGPDGAVWFGEDYFFVSYMGNIGRMQ